MKIVLSQFATKQLKSIYNYYAESVSIEKAKGVKRNLLIAIKQLVDFPYLGQQELLVYSKYERRYLLVLGYKILYEIVEEDIIILDIFHTKQSPTKMYLNEEPIQYQSTKNI